MVVNQNAAVIKNIKFFYFSYLHVIMEARNKLDKIEEKFNEIVRDYEELKQNYTYTDDTIKQLEKSIDDKIIIIKDILKKKNIKSHPIRLDKKTEEELETEKELIDTYFNNLNINLKKYPNKEKYYITQFIKFLINRRATLEGEYPNDKENMVIKEIRNKLKYILKTYKTIVSKEEFVNLIRQNDLLSPIKKEFFQSTNIKTNNQIDPNKIEAYINKLGGKKKKQTTK
jgi:hypothetical protein